MWLINHNAVGECSEYKQEAVESDNATKERTW